MPLSKKYLRNILFYGASFLLFIIIGWNIYYLTKKHNGFFENANVKNTSVRFANPVVDVGRRPIGSEVLVHFKMINTGNYPLYIEDVVVDCHCTTSSYTQKAIVSGDSTFIDVRYDSTLLGYFQKKIIVKTNTVQSPSLLIFRGELFK